MKKYDLSIKLTDRERSIIIGSLLGDASISKGVWKGKPGNARVRFVQGKAQLEYLKWKKSELQMWIGTPPNLSPIATEYGGAVHRLNTLTHPVFTEICDLIKPEGKGKRITQELLSFLDDLAIAVWFMDDGSMYQSSAIIAAYSFPQEDLELACSHLTQKGITSKVMQTCKGRVIIINADGARSLKRVIAPYIHPCLSYKLGKVLDKHCVYCGDPFTTTLSRTTCSDHCERRMRGESIRRTATQKRENKVCPICGVIFYPIPKGKETVKTCSPACGNKLSAKTRTMFTA